MVAPPSENWSWSRSESEIDDSVNFVATGDFEGSIEARYVRREAHYFISYVSSQTACRQGCRMCWLSQSRQTKGVDVGVEGILSQADRVLEWYDSRPGPRAQAVHFNFMARGEVFANRLLTEQGGMRPLLEGLLERADDRNLVGLAKLSTILPKTLGDRDLAGLFGGITPHIYYSLYSLDPAFRRRWLPNAIPPHEALARLADYQALTRSIPILHWCFIAGENDSAETIDEILEAVHQHGLRVDLNIVRYNPFDPRTGTESDEDVVQARAEQLRRGLGPGARVRVVPRVGFDVKASCGMFVPKGQPQGVLVGS